MQGCFFDKILSSIKPKALRKSNLTMVEQYNSSCRAVTVCILCLCSILISACVVQDFGTVPKCLLSTVAEILVGPHGKFPPPSPKIYEFSEILTKKSAKNSLFECKWGGGGDLKDLSEI